MPLIASAKSDNVSVPAPAGTHLARCVHVIDLGTQHSTAFDKTQHRIRIGFELPTKLHTFDEQRGPEPFIVSREFTLSLNEKSALRPFLEGWRGRAFTDPELDGFDIEKLLDKPCLLSVVHKPKQDGRGAYANINGATPLVEGMSAPPRLLPLVFYTIDMGQNQTFKDLPEWLRDKIMNSLEFADAKRTNGSQAEPPSSEPPTDDDVPF